MQIINKRNHLDLNESQFIRQYNILAKCLTKFNTFDGPRMGDFVLMPDNTYRRFCADWDTEIQITPAETSGSFCINSGYCDYSGTLEPCIPKDKLRFIHEYKLGRVWFFLNGVPAAHCGIDAEIPCRVFKYDP